MASTYLTSVGEMEVEDVLALGLMPSAGFCAIGGGGGAGLAGGGAALKSSMGGSSLFSDGGLSLFSSWRRFSRLSTRFRRASGDGDG